MADYRKIKKLLNKYHSFSFKMPSKGKSFKPQQKSAITRTYNKYKDLIAGIAEDKNSFIRYPKKSKLPNVDGVRSSKGIFFKYAGAKLVNLTPNKKVKKFTVKIKHKGMREMFIPFPRKILLSIDLIKEFVNSEQEIYSPDYIMWSVNGFRGRSRYDPELFDLYAAQLAINPQIVSALRDKPFYNGVFFGWFPKD